MYRTWDYRKTVVCMRRCLYIVMIKGFCLLIYSDVVKAKLASFTVFFVLNVSGLLNASLFLYMTFLQNMTLIAFRKLCHEKMDVLIWATKSVLLVLF